MWGDRDARGTIGVGVRVRRFEGIMHHGVRVAGRHGLCDGSELHPRSLNHGRRP